ncbi:MAG: site-2 protease family protein [Candidatus Poribacteria bacterium]|nr:site-2 protease family protein [Candidatus Poribacteria bacterium]MDE0317558.1 site-2 protease family protein [Candidatus Poribacteria bacterium]
MFTQDRVYLAILRVTQFIILLTFHEWGHAKSANMLGDSTARDQGRMSLNPAVHIDPIGTLFLPLIGTFFGGGFFGWAKPVPVNPYNLRHPRRDLMLIAAAGPFMNIVLTFVILGVLKLLLVFGVLDVTESVAHYQIKKELVLSAFISVFLAAFNLLPLFPLDGFSVVNGLLPERASREFSKLAPYGLPILLALIFLPSLIGIPNFVFIFLHNITTDILNLIGIIVGVR